MPFIPHTENDVKTMLETIGVNDIQQLFDEIPSELLYQGDTNIENGINEMAISQLIQKKAKQNTNLYVLRVVVHTNIISLLVFGKLSLEVNFILLIRRTRLKPVKVLCSCYTNIKP